MRGVLLRISKPISLFKFLYISPLKRGQGNTEVRMNIKKNVEIPTNIGRNRLGELNLAVKEFAESDDLNMKVECETNKEAITAYSTISGFISRYHLPLRLTKSMNDIYVVRK